jgi:hypothetical protein
MLCCIGTWGNNKSDKTSNWQEFTNIGDSLKDEAEDGKLTNSVVCLFTDNSNIEAAIYKGSSSSQKLLALWQLDSKLRKCTPFTWWFAM